MTAQWNLLDEYEAAQWCQSGGYAEWPLDRSLRVWLVYEKDVNWNPDDPVEQQQYDTLFDNVLDVWREQA